MEDANVQSTNSESLTLNMIRPQFIQNQPIKIKK